MQRPWTREELDSLAEAAKPRNQACGITGRLLVLSDSFVHALEGPAGAIDLTLESIRRDPRHTDILVLADTPVNQRRFSDWTLELSASAEARSAQAVRNAQQEAADLDAAGLPKLGSAEIAAMLDRVDRPFIDLTMRTTPVQARARKTVERIIEAGERVGRATGELPPMQDIADAAGMPLVAVYRYFSRPDAVVEMLVRLHTLKRHQEFRDHFKDLKFSSLEALAAEAADFIALRFSKASGIRGRLIHIILRDYHRIAYSELWALAGDLQDALQRNGFLAGGRAQQDRIAMALAAASSFTKMAVLHAPAQHNDPYLRRGLEAILLNGFRGQTHSAC